MAISLSKVIENYDVKGKYCLISDIEGADAAIFYNDIASLDNCERIIAELDDSPLGTIEDQIEKLKSIGFSVTERYGQVIVMSRWLKINVYYIKYIYLKYKLLKNNECHIK